MATRARKERVALHRVLLSNALVHFMEREETGILDDVKDALGREYAEGCMAIFRAAVHHRWSPDGPAPSDADIREMGRELAEELGGIARDARTTSSPRRAVWGIRSVVLFEGKRPIGLLSVKAGQPSLAERIREYELHGRRPAFGVYARP